MRIDVLNPNASQAVTAAMAEGLHALPVASRHAIRCSELADAPPGIETDAHVAEVAPMVAAFAARSRADALVVACFSDPGVGAARAATAIPVIGIAEAAYLLALQLAPRFGVVSLGPSSIARHVAQIERLGLASRLAGDRAVGMTVAEGHGPDALSRVEPVARALVDRDGAGVVILGCAGLGGLRADLQDRLGIPVIDPVQAGVAAAASLLEMGYGGRPMTDRLICGTIVTPDGVRPGGWIAVEGERIAATGTGPRPRAAEIDDHRDALLLPGVVDGQTHATSAKGLAGIAETTRGAVAGGVTTLVDMPYDNPAPLDRSERFDAKARAIAEHAHADMALYGTATAETGTANLHDLIARGVVAFKISAFESDPTRFPRISADLTLDLLEALAPTDLPLGLHNEDQEIVRARIARARAAGAEGIAAHATARPEAAELSATAAFHALGLATGAHTHAVHLTTGTGFALTRALAGVAPRATGELCVHYLWFDAATDGAALGARMKVNPPIRPGAIDGLWRAIEAGEVAFVSSDHSSWPIEGKLTASIFDAGAGVPGVETLLPAFYTAAVRRAPDQAAALTARMLSDAPARFFGIDDRKGRLATGRDADIAVLEPGRLTWDEAQAHDGLAWSPFHGRDFAGRVRATYLRGRPVWDGQTVSNAPGAGRLVRRNTAGWFAREDEA
ncbi:aspartate/glutamate racemase family protein [Jannaschia ovalis]|uniref:Aspartate/glutamate racemase family protein n=1 Tax=Jannaschia ovalis TaxID=3038773 RepID=A0ABY8LDA9_9RHOB|nr:aspartate/glutamate racemase family protein [Jannaschia sp. GRR-S6-38]WGH78050.1 aspartate/glutamate racemase family protein [Jannaschia sp. GRR-S6-38]